MLVETVRATAVALARLMSTPSALTAPLSSWCSSPTGVPKGALPAQMSGFLTDVALAFVYHIGVRSSNSGEVLTTFLGQIFSCMGFLSINGCPLVPWSGFVLVERRTLCHSVDMTRTQLVSNSGWLSQNI